jgi:bifunctional DNA-binding transcriptional regulator/antitoxin component of YhaV-PrlF toxin-antitoxin module
MEKENEIKEKAYFEEIIKKTKTGITFPKNIRDELFGEKEEIYFKLVVPKEKDKIILEILNDNQIKELAQKKDEKKQKVSKTKQKEKISSETKSASTGPNWGDYFVYDFEAKNKIQPILESAYYKFAETPINLEDAMGRVKYALISFLSSTKTENAKLYFSIVKFLIDIVGKFNQPNILDWIFEKVIPNIESKFLYELALLELVDISLKTKRYEKAEIYTFYVLKNIDDYPKSELYNIMNSFKQLVKKVRNTERSLKIDVLLKEKLLEYGQGIEDIDYKIQVVEMLEDLNYIEMAYDMAKKIQVNLPPDSVKLEDIRKIVNRLHIAPITEQKDLI